MARRRQVSRGTRRAGAAGRGWQGALHRVGGRIVAAAVAAELSREPRLAEPATQAEHWEAQRDPGSRLLGISGCLEIRVGRDPGAGWIGDSRISGFKSPTAMERGVYQALPRSLPGLLGEGDAKVRREPSPDFRSLRSPGLSFPETGGGCTFPAPKALSADFGSGARRALRPDAAGVREAVGAWSRRHATGALRVCRI